MKIVDRELCHKICKRPERIVWVVTNYKKVNICSIGWKMLTSKEPPMFAVSVYNKHYTHKAISETGEFVISWPGKELAEETYLCGTKSGNIKNKMDSLPNLKLKKAEKISVPIIENAIANYECRLVDKLLTGDHTIFVGEILTVWTTDNPGKVLCSIDGSAGYDKVFEKGRFKFGTVKYKFMKCNCHY